jgi:hypothetical protein
MLSSSHRDNSFLRDTTSAGRAFELRKAPTPPGLASSGAAMKNQGSHCRCEAEGQQGSEANKKQSCSFKFFGLRS